MKVQILGAAFTDEGTILLSMYTSENKYLTVEFPEQHYDIIKFCVDSELHL